MKQNAAKRALVEITQSWDFERVCAPNCAQAHIRSHQRKPAQVGKGKSGTMRVRSLECVAPSHLPIFTPAASGGPWLFQLLDAGDVLEVTDDETRPAQIVTGAAGEKESAVGDHRKIRVRNNISFPVIHTDAERFAVRFTDQSAQFTCLHEH